MHPLHRRTTRGRNWPLLQDKVPPLLVKRLQTTNSSQCLPQSTYHCQDTVLGNVAPTDQLEEIVENFFTIRENHQDFFAQSSAFRGKFPECLCKKKRP